jgi:hypothetical protein
MIKKGNLWMADWFDSEGHRRRKGFTTERQALSHQSHMRKETAQSKKSLASQRSARFVRRGRTLRATTTRVLPRSSSAGRRARS